MFLSVRSTEINSSCFCGLVETANQHEFFTGLTLFSPAYLRVFKDQGGSGGQYPGFLIDEYLIELGQSRSTAGKA